jgi:hypothetical protein
LCAGDFKFLFEAGGFRSLAFFPGCRPAPGPIQFTFQLFLVAGSVSKLPFQVRSFLNGSGPGLFQTSGCKLGFSAGVGEFSLQARRLCRLTFLQRARSLPRPVEFALQFLQRAVGIPKLLFQASTFLATCGFGLFHSACSKLQFGARIFHLLLETCLHLRQTRFQRSRGLPSLLELLVPLVASITYVPKLLFEVSALFLTLVELE